MLKIQDLEKDRARLLDALRILQGRIDAGELGPVHENGRAHAHIIANECEWTRDLLRELDGSNG